MTLQRRRVVEEEKMREGWFEGLGNERKTRKEWGRKDNNEKSQEVALNRRRMVKGEENMRK